ncbi:glycogen debranching N-terminal domain-containing protein [Kribbella sp. NPDC048928]|uniref:amylo-alpha-1,6-glucosidase n=1 Tax=Kribbella sp. NPDC048928 TaxID=3364111 RepID=UPI003713742F
MTDPVITLVEGSCFAISATTGDMRADSVDGLYCDDTRIVSGWRLLVDGRPPQPLSAQLDAPYQATFLGRRDGDGGSLLVERHRLVGDGMREDLILRNLGTQDITCRVAVELTVDFADLFSVKDSKPLPLGEVQWTLEGDSLLAEAEASGRQRGLRLRLDGLIATAPRTVAGDLLVPAGGQWRGTMEVLPLVDHEESKPTYPRGEPVESSMPATRLREWQESSPVVELPGLRFDGVVDRSIQDIGSLRIRTAAPNGRVNEIVAAGAPWFMTLFGRDSLLTAWMALPIDQQLALSTLRALAALQGHEVNPSTEEEPGRILHEVRHGASFPLSPGSGVYYGTADATPLFCMLVGELHRWGVPKEQLAPLIPHVDRALTWILDYGDRDSDGFVEYQRTTDRGLQNQGWKDSHDSISFADGTLAEGPIALAEVQAYVYGAFRARSELAATFDPPAVAREWADRADMLRRRFHDAFWLPSDGYYALALDGRKRPVDALASNMGHALWTGLVDPRYAARVAEHLVSPELFSGWGIRTLSRSMTRYDPVSYHNGSVWPHDTAICVAGLARYGLVEDAVRVSSALLEAAVAFGDRLPELFCGFDRTEFGNPVPYPTSCSPQAWAAAAPFLLVRSVLGLEPDIPAGRVYVDPPTEPSDLTGIGIRRLPLAGRRITVSRHTGEGLDGLDLIRTRRFATGGLRLPNEPCGAA